MSAQLQGKNVLIITANAGIERDELLKPLQALQEQGATVTYATVKGGQAQTWVQDSEKDVTVDSDTKIQGLDAGADDYITKPFSTRELVSRIRAVLRRSSSLSAEKAIEAEGLKLDPVSHRVTANDTPVEMGPTEYRLLAFFMSHQERAYSRSQMLDQVWGGNVYVEDRTIDVHIRRLRKALEPFGFDRFIQTVRGTGYRFSTRVDGPREPVSA